MEKAEIDADLGARRRAAQQGPARRASRIPPDIHQQRAGSQRPSDL
ncbi:MAG: hypothetical protein IPP10_02255 [Candidatus Competibacteraceae bacterium]|nr:hypothetical protein [Candidatus Competibacteraceae bacterium]